MRDWDKIMKDKTQRKDEPYTDVTEMVAVPVNESRQMFGDDKPKDIQKFVEKLMGYQKDSIKRNYTVSSDQVTQAQIDAAQEKLDEIIDATKVNADIEKLNEMLVHYYRIIPRKMKKVQDHLIQSLSTKADLKKAFDDILTLEQDALDSMAGQVSTTKAVTVDGEDNKNTDVMDALGISMQATTPAEVKMIKTLLGADSGRFVQAFRVNLSHTSSSYEAWLAAAVEKKTALLWHGSRNENWWSILQKGLMIRPSGVVLTGSMFGNGVYFADKAKKSIGYSSARGSYWAGGNSDKAYLALYDIHQGKQLEILNWKSEHSSLDEDKMKKKGYDSVFAKGGADLVNNEYIVYNPAQCTVRYIVEIQ
jgi:poly [ADP-ribose] polymerase